MEPYRDTPAGFGCRSIRAIANVGELGKEFQRLERDQSFALFFLACLLFRVQTATTV